MTPRGNKHEVVKEALLRRRFRMAPDDVDLTPETTFRLSGDTYLEPDAVIYPRATGLGGLTGESVLLVVEIANSSLRYDTEPKAALYANSQSRRLGGDGVDEVGRVSSEGLGITAKLAFFAHFR